MNDPTSWSTFQDAVDFVQHRRAHGIGFVFTDADDFVGIDLDSCRDAATEGVEQWALDIVERFPGAYWEISPSKTGLHAIMLGKLPHGGRKQGQIEVYERARYFTMTADFFSGEQFELADYTEDLAAWHAEIFGQQMNGKPHRGRQRSGKITQDVIDALSYIPADDYQVWLDVGMALHSADTSTETLTLWDSWSKSCAEKYTPGECQKKWRSFSADRDDGITLGTLFAFARRNGYRRHAGHDTAAVQPSAEPPWPTLEAAALHGLAGEIVQTIDPHTEADPVAVLLNVLTAFGSCINTAAHMKVQHDVHPARLFVVQVGDTSKGRKGTGWSTPRYLFSQADPHWAEKRIKSGLSSGEGLIYQVRDAVYTQAPVKKGGRFTGEYDTICADEGEDDKRLLVIEPEFASVLTVADRDKSCLFDWTIPAKPTVLPIVFFGHSSSAQKSSRMERRYRTRSWRTLLND